jgi:hypothetical protein
MVVGCAWFSRIMGTAGWKDSLEMSWQYFVGRLALMIGLKSFEDELGWLPDYDLYSRASRYEMNESPFGQYFDEHDRDFSSQIYPWHTLD